MNAHKSNSSLFLMYFDGNFAKSQAALNAAFDAVDRRLQQVIHRLKCMRPERAEFFVVNVGNEYDRLGGLDWKYPAGDFCEPTRVFAYRESPGNVDPDNKLNSIPDLITTIKHRLRTEMAPMTAV